VRKSSWLTDPRLEVDFYQQVAERIPSGFGDPVDAKPKALHAVFILHYPGFFDLITFLSAG
jgi:hypothetical protein